VRHPSVLRSQCRGGARTGQLVRTAQSFEGGREPTKSRSGFAGDVRTAEMRGTRTRAVEISQSYRLSILYSLLNGVCCRGEAVGALGRLGKLADWIVETLHDTERYPHPDDETRQAFLESCAFIQKRALFSEVKEPSPDLPPLTGSNLGVREAAPGPC